MATVASPTARAYLDALRASDTAQHIRVIDLVRAGLPLDLVAEAARHLGLSLQELTDLGVLAARTVAHSRRAGHLSPAQSDRVTRFLRVFQHAVETFGTAGKARDWMTRPTRALDGRRPVDLFDTDADTRLVDDLLSCIDHGLAA